MSSPIFTSTNDEHIDLIGKIPIKKYETNSDHNITKHQKYLNDNVDNYEVIFDVDEILGGHQKNLDDNIDNYEVISDVDEILKHQNYLDDVVISDNAVKIATDLNDANDANDTKILLNISAKNYLYNYYNSVEEFDDKLCLIDYEMFGEEIPPPSPYSEKDIENLTALKELLPSPYNECDISTLKNILPPDYNKLDNNIIINIIHKYVQENNVQENNVQENNNNVQENNVQDNEPSWFKTIKKIVKEVENLVDKAAKAHQAAVNIEKKRLSSNPSKPELSEKEKEAINAVSDAKDLIQHSNYNLTEEIDDSMHKDKYEVDEILGHQKNLDDNIDNYEVISDVDEIFKHQNYLNDVVISDNAVKIATDLNDTNDTRILLTIKTKNYLYNYYNVAEEFVDEIDNLFC
ncbi:hypothetical protein C1646_661165 [Rhizophagus diaphanus]|nr:hypothetical protein C1646_661165 [Rhizophagus diaphanus] [Rhizophagus sp. MUCL 43196]